MADARARHDCLGVVHIPKCGGVALRIALSHLEATYTGPLYFDHTACFGVSDYVWSTPSPNRETIASARDLQSVVTGHRLVIGHYGGLQLVNAGCDMLAVQVREPRSRLLSLYRYWQSRPESELASWGRWGSDVVAKASLPFGDFLYDPNAWPATDNAVARQTLGVYTKAGPALWRTLRLSRAYNTFKPKLSIVDWTSSSERLLERICERLAFSPVPPLGHENATEVTGEPQLLDTRARRRLELLTSIDQSFLDRLCADGVLSRRSRRDLDSEFGANGCEAGFRLQVKGSKDIPWQPAIGHSGSTRLPSSSHSSGLSVALAP